MQLTLPTIQELTQPYQHYPKIIQQAILLADSHPSLTAALTRGYRAVLRNLVTIVSKSDGCAPFTVIPHLLALKADVSEKTVQRGLSALKKFGLVAQLGDGRDDTGAFTRHCYQFTEHLAGVLRLPVKTCSSRKTKTADDLYIELTLVEDHPKISSKTKTGKAAPVELPPELASLPDELGIKDTGIAALRGLAFKAGHQLEHIVACARAQLKKLSATGNRAFRYLEAMIAKPSDYAGRASQATRVEAEKEKAAKDQSDAEKYRGKRFTASNGDIFRINECGAVATIISASGAPMGSCAGRDMAVIFSMIQAGKLKKID